MTCARFSMGSAICSFSLAASAPPLVRPDAPLAPIGWPRCRMVENRRRFILDCTGCHQFDETRTRKDGAPRSEAAWAADLTRMLQYAGPRSNFPVISAWPEGSDVAAWIAGGAAKANPTPAVPKDLATDVVVTEYDFPVAQDLPHDVAIDPAGKVVVTGMFSDAMFVLDPATAKFERVEIPVPQANPRAVELDPQGDWWGSPG